MTTDPKLLRLIGKKIRDRIKSRIRENRIKPKTEKGGGTTLVESSNLVNSITYKIEGNTIYVGTNVKYAKIHHFGGIIRPKKAKYLAIPLTKAAKALSPRDFKDTFIAKGVIFKDNGKDKPTPLYVLKKQVKIPARPYMIIDDNDEKIISNIIKKYYEHFFK